MPRNLSVNPEYSGHKVSTASLYPRKLLIYGVAKGINSTRGSWYADASQLRDVAGQAALPWPSATHLPPRPSSPSQPRQAIELRAWVLALGVKLAAFHGKAVLGREVNSEALFDLFSS